MVEVVRPQMRAKWRGWRTHLWIFELSFQSALLLIDARSRRPAVQVPIFWCCLTVRVGRTVWDIRATLLDLATFASVAFSLALTARLRRAASGYDL